MHGGSYRRAFSRVRLTYVRIPLTALHFFSDHSTTFDVGKAFSILTDIL